MMKRILLVLVLGSLSLLSFSQDRLPYIEENQLIVDGQPFLMIGGELHNSSASSAEYMDSLWPKLKSLNLNTVLATVTWDQFEPSEGKYDYELIDYLISKADENNMKLVVVWFGSWKNGQSSYIPLWVKQDYRRFPRVKSGDGSQIETLSVFSNESRAADASAFTELMKRIKEKDQNNTVIMVQPENEVGIFQDIDYRKEALDAYKEDVPKALIDYLVRNRKLLKPEVRGIWEAAGSKTSGSWKDVFGDNPQSKEFFMAWHYASYIDYVASSGRAEHNLPMFVNAWIVQKPEDLPGVYPNGGPVSRVMDIYKAAASSLDVVCPDIYLPNYKEIYEMYFREDNPLLVPESSLDAGRAFYAFAEFDAICFSPFGIEDAAGDILFSKSYGVLKELHSVIADYQGTGKMRGIHLTKEYQDHTIEIEGTTISFKIQDPNKAAFGLIIKLAENEFLLSGMNFKARFSEVDGKMISYIGQVVEGRFEKGQWKELRWLNGDETYHHELVRALGRNTELSKSFQFQETNLDVSEEDQFVYSAGGTESVTTPAIYKITLYQREK